MTSNLTVGKSSQKLTSMSTPSETSSLLSTSAPHVARLREELKQACGGDGKLQKSEFKSLLFGRGIYIKQAVLEDIFCACDADGDGSLTVDELFNYCGGSQPKKTWWDGVQYTARETSSSVVWWFAVAFHFAAWVGITSFCFKVAGRTIAPEWSIVGAWFFFFGAVYFFKLLLDSKSSNYDTMLQAKIILKQCVEKDPSFFQQHAGVDAQMDQLELNAVLEEQALYLPKSILTQIFDEIDVDKGGVLTKEELDDFAKTQQINPTSEERQRKINESVVSTWGFWSLICWFIGSVLFLVGAHLSFAGYTEPPLPHNTYLHLYGMGSVMYWLIAFCMIPLLADEANEYLEGIEQMSKAFSDRSERGGLATSDQLFRSLDVRGSSRGNTDSLEGEQSDGNLDVMELYDALIEEGVLIPHDTFLELFKSADETGDGLLQLAEFTKLISSMQVGSKDPWKYRLQMANRIPFTSSFFGWLMFFVGGFCYTMGSYVDLVGSADWYFGGAVCYCLASGKNVFGTIKNNWLHFQAVEAGKSQFEARIAASPSGGVVC